MAAADKMLRHQLRRLHVVRADQVDIVKIAGAGSKHQRHPRLRRTLAQLAPAVDRPGDNHPVHPCAASVSNRWAIFSPLRPPRVRNTIFPCLSGASVRPAVNSA